MGLCRGFNLLLGASLLKTFPPFVLVCAVIETAFIAGVSVLARRETESGRIKPKHIGLLLGLLIPLQAVFCLMAGAGTVGWISAAILLTFWPLNRWLRARFYAS